MSPYESGVLTGRILGVVLVMGVVIYVLVRQRKKAKKHRDEDKDQMV